MHSEIPRVHRSHWPQEGSADGNGNNSIYTPRVLSAERGWRKITQAELGWSSDNPVLRSGSFFGVKRRAPVLKTPVKNKLCPHVD